MVYGVDVVSVVHTALVAVFPEIHSESTTQIAPRSVSKTRLTSGNIRINLDAMWLIRFYRYGEVRERF
jgi:hypothetical protein